MSFEPPTHHPHPHPQSQLQAMPALTPILETSSTFVAPPHVPLAMSPLKQLGAPPIPFVPQYVVAMPSSFEEWSLEESSEEEEITDSFYTLDPNAEAIFSTINGARPKREMVKPFPAPVARVDLADDVDARVTQLMKEFPEETANMGPLPQSWYILHKYFDSHDLIIDGAKFCFHVLHAICRKNVEDNRLSSDHLMEINMFARDWVMMHPDRVMRSLDVSPMITLFTEDERRHELAGMTRNEILVLERQLAYHRYHWREVLVAQQGHQLVDPGPPLYLQHGQHIPSIEPRVSEHQLSGNPMGAPIMPEAERIRRDSNASMKHGPASDQQILHRGSLQGQQGRQIQGFNGTVDNSGRQIIPTGFQNQGHPQEIYNGNGPMQPGGFSNSTQNMHRDSFQGSFQGNGRRYGGSSSGNNPSQEPVYVRQKSPRFGDPTFAGKRVISAPTPGVLYCPVNDKLNGGRPRAMSPMNREKKFHNSQAMVPSPTERGDLRKSHRYGSGSSVPQGPGILPSSPSRRMAHSNDARISITPEKFPSIEEYEIIAGHDDRRVSKTPEKKYPFSEIHDSNHSCTITYCPSGRDDDNTRTVHVTGFNGGMIFSHHLRDVMEECGKVTSINHLHLSQGMPRAFVTFLDSCSVEPAISRFNYKKLPSGHTLKVGLPTRLPTSLGNPRSGSNAASQGYRNRAYNSSRDTESRSGHPSIRNSSNDFLASTNSRRPSVICNPTSPPGSMMDQLQATAAGVLHHESAIDRQMPLSSIENVHLQRNNKKHGKGSKQNNSVRRTPANSTRPTPAATPVKSMSVVDLKDVGALQITTNLSKLPNGKGGQLLSSDVENNKPKKFLDSSKSNASFHADAHAALSPLESESMTRDTSFSAESSRVPTQSTISRITKSHTDVDIPRMNSGAATAKFRHKKYSRGGGKRVLDTANQEVNITTGPLVVACKQVDVQKESNQAVASHSKKSSNVSMASSGFLRKVDAVSAKASKDPIPTIVSTPEVKPDGQLDLTTSCNIPPVVTLVPSTQSPKNNDEEWPSLVKAPPLGPDAKRLPPPVMGPLTSAPKGFTKPVKPAVPRAFETQPRPLRERGSVFGLDLGTETWPFVRKFTGK